MVSQGAEYSRHRVPGCAGPHIPASGTSQLNPGLEKSDADNEPELAVGDRMSLPNCDGMPRGSHGFARRLPS